MKAAVIYEHGGRDVLRYVDDLPIPEPGLGEVRLRMGAAALNRLDLFVREGWKGLTLHMPHVTCSDGAGVVDAVGPGVAGLHVGDRVAVDPTIIPPACLESGDDPRFCDGVGIMGEHYPGFGAEYVLVPTRNCVVMPDHVGYAEAAAAGLVYVTAWHSLMTRGGLRAGESVLIVGAGGGVNTASVQIAKLAGCRVIVIGSSAERCTQAADLGADEVIDRSQTPNWSRAVYELTGKRGVDVVVDNVGQATLFDSIRAVRRGGRILIGSTMGPHEDYVQAMRLVFTGKLKPIVGVCLPLDQVAEGHRLLEAGEVFGKVVIEIGH